MTTETTMDINQKALAILKADAQKILHLINLQMENLTMPQCPLYEEVIDTQMFGLSREIEFAIRLELISEQDGKQILADLEKMLVNVHEAYKSNQITQR